MKAGFLFNTRPFFSNKCRQNSAEKRGYIRGVFPNEKEKTCDFGRAIVTSGDYINVDGREGSVYQGPLKVRGGIRKTQYMPITVK